MEDNFQISIAGLNSTAQVKKTPYYLSMLREGKFSVSVERLPLIEYYAFFDSRIKAEQIKVKVYKTPDGRWYDKNYSEEAEVYSPEFGIPEIKDEIKEAIDVFESHHEKIKDYF